MSPIVLFEAQIQNITNSILFMDKVKLHPLREDIKIIELNQMNSSNSDQVNTKKFEI